MPKSNTTSRDPRPSVISHSAQELIQQNLEQAKALLAAYQDGDPKAIAHFKENHPEGDRAEFIPSLQDAHLMVAIDNVQVTRLSLEKLKKEAKELLKALKQGQTEALKRLKDHHPKGEYFELGLLKLADAQLIIARENGLPSWPKLKKHFELIDQAQQHLKQSSLTLDKDRKTLHIRCGNDIQNAINTSGFSGDFMEISNPFPQGPVPPFNPVEQFINVRTDFILQNYAIHIPPEFAERVQATPDEIRKVENRLRALPDRYERIVLWFEHDPFDQLCFAYLLAHLVDCPLDGCNVELVQANRFPGVKKFVSIGYLGQYPEGLIALWQQRVKVTPAMTAFGARCWNAFTSGAADELWKLIQGTSPLPLMQQAMLRMLKELPWTSNGLSLTEQLALEIVDREGPINVAKLFRFLNTETDPMPFLGDIMFLSVVQHLWRNKRAALNVISTDDNKPAIAKETVELTVLGRELINGHCDWLSICDENYERWVGGAQIVPHKGNWYWSPEKGRPIFKPFDPS